MRRPYAFHEPRKASVSRRTSSIGFCSSCSPSTNQKSSIWRVTSAWNWMPHVASPTR